MRAGRQIRSAAGPIRSMPWWRAMRARGVLSQPMRLRRAGASAPPSCGESLERLADEGRVVRGRFGGGATSDAGAKAPEREWVAAEVFRRLRSRSLAKARAAVQAVPGSAFVRLVLDLQDVAGATGAAALEGTDGVAQVIAQFEGVFLPAAAWEGQVLPARVRDFRPGDVGRTDSLGRRAVGGKWSRRGRAGRWGCDVRPAVPPPRLLPRRDSSPSSRQIPRLRRCAPRCRLVRKALRLPMVLRNALPAC